MNYQARPLASMSESRLQSRHAHGQDDRLYRGNAPTFTLD